MFSHPSSAPTSRPASPLAGLLTEDSDGSSRLGSESPATLVDRPLAPSRPQSLKNTELLALAGTDYSVAVARALAEEGSVEETPARGVRGDETVWWLDEDAASALPR